jgi:hypothetical protein
MNRLGGICVNVFDVKIVLLLLKDFIKEGVPCLSEPHFTRELLRSAIA